MHSAIHSATAKSSPEVGKTLTVTLSNCRNSNGLPWLTGLFAILTSHAIIGLALEVLRHLWPFHTSSAELQRANMQLPTSIRACCYSTGSDKDRTGAERRPKY